MVYVFVLLYVGFYDLIDRCVRKLKIRIKNVNECFMS